MVTIQVKKLNSIEQIKGLMFVKKAEPVLIQTRWGIHTFFLRFPIDVLVLDGSNKVVKIKRGMKPNRIFLWNPKYDRVLELPTSKAEVKIGDLINLTILNS